MTYTEATQVFPCCFGSQYLSEKTLKLFGVVNFNNFPNSV